MPAIVIDGHPNPESFTAAIASRYVAAHGDAELLVLRDLDFDPVLRVGYRGEQPLEPDLLAARAAIERADRLVLVVPVWWGSIPALAKGFFDRAFLPGWAFRYRKSGLVDGLLAGRTGRIIVTTDSPWWYLRLVGDTTVRHVRGRILRFSGLRPVSAMRLGPIRNSKPAQRESWLEKVAAAAGRDAASDARRRRRASDASVDVTPPAAPAESR
jgi:putative NADPH-quinone reductase